MGNPAPAPDTPPKTTVRPLYDTAGTTLAMNCKRWKIWDLCKNDPEFPKPRVIAGKNQWFQDEIETYKATRPCRQYAGAAA